MTDHPRLPLPGEQPISIFRPRPTRVRRPTLHGAARLFPLIPWLIVALIGYAGLRVWRATATHVTLVVSGQPVEVATHRRTVAGAARTAGYVLGEALYLDPPADTPLADGMVIVLAPLRPVQVYADGQTFTVNTRLTDPYQIAAELGITLGPDDAVRIERAIAPSLVEIAANPALANVPALPREIRVVRAVPVIVREIQPGGQPTEVSFTTTQPTLGQALSAAGYLIYEADRINPPTWTALGGPLTVTIERAMPVGVRADGRDYRVRTHQTTVGGLLGELGLALAGEDYAIPPPDAPLVPDGAVRLVRVREEVVVETEPVPFGMSYTPDPDLPLDQQRELQSGRDGTLERRVRLRYEDGQLVSRVVIGEWLVERSQARVVAYGAKITIRALETPGGTLYYWRMLRVLATSYSPATAGHKQPGDPFYGLSGTGAAVQRGIIATDPAVIPLYTWMFVPGYGVGRALDVGGAIKGLRIDLGYDDANLVLWNSWVEIYLLAPVPPYDQIVWVLPG